MNSMIQLNSIRNDNTSNTTYIESKDTRILIDAGVNYTRIKKTLDNINVDIKSIDGIIISHTHSDHIGGLSSVIKKINVPVFIKEELYDDIKNIIPN